MMVESDRTHKKHLTFLAYIEPGHHSYMVYVSDLDRWPTMMLKS